MLSKGSDWQRWEPHIHAPGTVLEDRYPADGWEAYIAALENAAPPMRAIGITDYCVTSSYERVKAAKEAGRLEQCEFLFPNVELRLEMGTVKGHFVNIHLLANAEDPKHIEELNRFLRQLKFSTAEDEYCCSPADLIRLGKRMDRSLATDDKAALRVGVTQFKVSRNGLQAAFRSMEWARDNLIVAVSGNADGTSGVRDGADRAIREEIEKISNVIFASSTKQRDFWLGHSATASPQEILEGYGGLKPCLWGSDAHELSFVGKPAEDRLCWIKGKASFDGLRQACIDPDRAYVGPTPPSWSSESQTIDNIKIHGAPWVRTPDIRLNPGLVTIIGARGSGKTALADIIAAGCDAYFEDADRPSFLERAQEHLWGSEVSVKWLSGETSDAKDLERPGADRDTFPRVRYLSQQFVDRLCSPDGMPQMIQEIERVIFEAHRDRDGTINFQELLELRAQGHREARLREETAMNNISELIAAEREKITAVSGLKKQIAEKDALIKGYEKDRGILVPSTTSAIVAQQLQDLLAAADKVRGYLRYYAKQQAGLENLQSDVLDQRLNRGPQTLRDLKAAHAASKLDEPVWERFLLNFTGDVDGAIKAKAALSNTEVAYWKGSATPSLLENGSYVADGADRTKLSLAVLEAEIERLQSLVAVDKQTAEKLAINAKRITEETAKLAVLKEKLSDCEGAAVRRAELNEDRKGGYKRVFTAILAEETVLKDLYAPLMLRLATQGGTLAKLSFTVSRVADVKAWADKAEKELFDLRTGPFRGTGKLLKYANEELKKAWETGDVDAIAAAMEGFREKHQEELLEPAPDRAKDADGFRKWLKRFAQWLYSSDHISIEYGIKYDGTDIKKLSPGTRGIVLILLYLALDDADDKPLVIDQPEENLDPKSIYDELVPLFRAAKRKRQVIMVTHNANLVINTDADQVIIANVSEMTGDGLPGITYRSGGLDEADIRQSVCEILEGGEAAFRDRARRLHIKF
ncbi:ATP-binding protein [Mesorhizobium sp. M1A.T.Ca.IN.004.03.1.1]|uniref:TrlF family AAA-like ATPase n=1 Tax=Mesorhizobium sp. M1A.T.Ca.IN.004.03.1.1 TaxID=2496795 RepID=UPI000FCA42D1|nr:AAA family ATPase [Mesorhizobium sp. M1A.T.Ca.IN.004.03.1.1]RUV41285.1 ATP-binding protein [Mesorhizobium sp. M1A.T.Ca.IN.004.03.1.1]